MIDFVSKLAEFDALRSRWFYEMLAHNLTVSTRSIWSDDRLTDAMKVEQLKWMNEIQHRVIGMLRSTDSRRGVADFALVVEDHANACPAVAGHIGWAVKRSLEYVENLERA